MVRPNSDDAGDVDNWYAVEDRRQRKRIQDRLAQRARRMSLSSFAMIVSSNKTNTRRQAKDWLSCTMVVPRKKVLGQSPLVMLQPQ